MTCDQRRSRAARNLLKEHLRQYSAFELDVSEWTYWNFLEFTTVPLCNLRRDCFRNEAHNVILETMSSQKALYWQKDYYYHCGVCSKNFSSQEYLDRHTFSRHPSEDDCTCTADWCDDVLQCDQWLANEENNNVCDWVHNADACRARVSQCFAAPYDAFLVDSLCENKCVAAKEKRGRVVSVSSRWIGLVVIVAMVLSFRRRLQQWR